MTLQYLATARLNATPRIAHIDTPEQPKPQPTMTLAEYAVRENRAAGFNPAPKYTTGKTGPSKQTSFAELVLACVKEFGPITSKDVARKLNLKDKQVWNAIPEARRLATIEGLTWHVEDIKRTNGLGGPIRTYWVTT